MKNLGATIINVLTNGAFFTLVGLAATFWGLVCVFPVDRLIILLNGVWAGTMIAITFAYAWMIFGVFTGEKKFDDIRQMVSGFLGQQFAYACTVSTSVYVISTDDNGTALLITALGRFVSIVSAIALITAPNIGQPIFYARDSKILWASVAFGLVVSVTVVLIQATQAFAWPL